MSTPALPDPAALAAADAAAVLATARAQDVREERLVPFIRHVDLSAVARDSAGALEPAALGQAVARAAQLVPEFVRQLPERRRAPEPPPGAAGMGGVPTPPGGGDAEIAELTRFMREALGLPTPGGQA